MISPDDLTRWYNPMILFNDINQWYNYFQNFITIGSSQEGTFVVASLETEQLQNYNMESKGAVAMEG